MRCGDAFDRSLALGWRAVLQRRLQDACLVLAARLPRQRRLHDVFADRRDGHGCGGEGDCLRGKGELAAASHAGHGRFERLLDRVSHGRLDDCLADVLGHGCGDHGAKPGERVRTKEADRIAQPIDHLADLVGEVRQPVGELLQPRLELVGEQVLELLDRDVELGGGRGHDGCVLRVELLLRHVGAAHVLNCTAHRRDPGLQPLLAAAGRIACLAERLPKLPKEDRAADAEEVTDLVDVAVRAPEHLLDHLFGRVHAPGGLVKVNEVLVVRLEELGVRVAGLHREVLDERPRLLRRTAGSRDLTEANERALHVRNVARVVGASCAHDADLLDGLREGHRALLALGVCVHEQSTHLVRREVRVLALQRAGRLGKIVDVGARQLAELREEPHILLDASKISAAGVSRVRQRALRDLVGAHTRLTGDLRSLAGDIADGRASRCRVAARDRVDNERGGTLQAKALLHGIRNEKAAADARRGAHDAERAATEPAERSAATQRASNGRRAAMRRATRGHLLLPGFGRRCATGHLGRAHTDAQLVLFEPLDLARRPALLADLSVGHRLGRSDGGLLALLGALFLLARAALVLALDVAHELLVGALLFLFLVLGSAQARTAALASGARRLLLEAADLLADGLERPRDVLDSTRSETDGDRIDHSLRAFSDSSIRLSTGAATGSVDEPSGGDPAEPLAISWVTFDPRNITKSISASVRNREKGTRLAPSWSTLSHASSSGSVNSETNGPRSSRNCV